MKIWFYENIWRILKGLIPRGKSDLISHSKRMLWQMRLASLFGGAKFIVIGDSNAENLNTYPKRMRFAKEFGICVNIGIGGTRADSWVEFFTATTEGNQIYRMFLAMWEKDRTIKVLFNIGGNNILQSKMDVVEGSLKKLYQLFPMSYNCLIPPIHLSLLEQIGCGVYTRRGLIDGVDRVNNLIKTYWGKNTIDTYTPFMDKDTREAFLFVLQDAVHFSDLCDEKMRIPLIIFSLQV